MGPCHSVLPSRSPQPGAYVLCFEAPKGTLAKVCEDVADPESKLADGAWHSFLVPSGEPVPTSD